MRSVKMLMETTNKSSHAVTARLLAAFTLVWGAVTGPAGLAQTPPVLVSVSPANGATQVPTTSSLVFVFDQDMEASPLLIQSTPGLIGSYAVTAPGFNQTLAASWGADKRTLTIKPAIQFPYSTFTWTLNPEGALAFFRIKSQAGVELATVSGTFATGVGGTDPKLGSSSPANGATGVQTNAQVEFRFDQVMKRDPAVAGNPPTVPGAVAWGGVGIDPAKFDYTWSLDGRTLYCSYRGGFPFNTTVTWLLNPTAAPVKLRSQSDRLLASDTYSGHFITGNAEPLCSLSPWPPTWGSYSLAKRTDHRQTSTADPFPETNSVANIFTVAVNTPAAGSLLTAASLARPDGVVSNLALVAGLGQFSETTATEAVLDAKYPPGDYVLRFTQHAQPERVITFSLPPAYPPVPKITNFDEAQEVNPAADFDLRWNGFTDAEGLDFISMYLTDSLGRLVFQAPNLCVPRELPVTATSVVIPGNTLRANEAYSGGLLYGKLYYLSTNDVPEMVGFGNNIRNTYFTLKTGASGEPVAIAATLSSPLLLPNGNPQFAVSGTAGKSYGIQRTSSLTAPTWSEVGMVRLDVTGQGTFEDAQAGKTLPLYYRATAR